MTDKERFMYQIMGEISKANAPIVFKGALVTKLILAENGYTAVEYVHRKHMKNPHGE